MATYVLLAVLCVAPLASSMFLSHNMGGVVDFGYETPDAKIYQRDPFGNLQSFDLSSEPQFYRSPTGGISRVNVVELSPDRDMIHAPVSFNRLGAGVPGSLLSTLSQLNNIGSLNANLGLTSALGLGPTSHLTHALGLQALNGLGGIGLGGLHTLTNGITTTTTTNNGLGPAAATTAAATTSGLGNRNSMGTTVAAAAAASRGISGRQQFITTRNGLSPQKYPLTYGSPLNSIVTSSSPYNTILF